MATGMSLSGLLIKFLENASYRTARCGRISTPVRLTSTDAVGKKVLAALLDAISPDGHEALPQVPSELIVGRRTWVMFFLPRRSAVWLAMRLV